MPKQAKKLPNIYYAIAVPYHDGKYRNAEVHKILNQQSQY